MCLDYEQGRDLGSAAMLRGEQRILFFFVNDAGASPWTPDLRQTVELHAANCLCWLEQQSAARSVPLRFQYAFLPAGLNAGCDSGCHIDENDYCAGRHHSGWQNVVATGLTQWGTVAERWDELFNLCGLSLSGVDGSSAFFIVRRCVPSVAFPYKPGQADEFLMERGIIYDFGGVTDGQRHLDSLIAHELLHLYGAVDLEPGKAPADVPDTVCQYPDEVMNHPTQHDIAGYHIGALTEYLVGWRESNPLVNDYWQEDGTYPESVLPIEVTQ